MKILMKSFITKCLLFLSFGVFAHQTEISSTILVEQEENNWILQVRAALSAFEYEVEANFGKDAYSTPEEFQALVVKHLKENLSIQFNDNNGITLKNAMVRLGHETTVTFEVVGTPKNIQSLIVQNNSFDDISRNKSGLLLLKRGFSKHQFILNNDNNHTAKLTVNNAKFEMITPVKAGFQYSFLIIIGILSVLSILYFVIKKQ